MPRFLSLILAAALTTAAASQTAASTAPTTTQTKTMNTSADNPLLAKSKLAYQMPAFDQIRSEHYAPAFRAAMAEHIAELEQIANNPAPASFENTLVAIEKAGRKIDQVDRIFSNLNSLISDEAMQAVEREFAPLLAGHRDALWLHPTLFARVQSLYQQKDKLQLDPESLHLLERHYQDMVRNGAKLSAADQAKLRNLNRELAELDTRFNQNVMKEVQAQGLLVADKAELAGLSEDQIKGLAQAAESRGHQGKYWLELTNTTSQAYNASLQNRALRARLHQASVQRGAQGGAYDNRELILQQAKLRAEKAQLLGFANYAAFSVAEETAGKPEAVDALLKELAAPAVANARREAQAMQALIDQEKGGFQLAAYDWDWYAEKVRKAKYNFDETQLRPYFELKNVLHKGVFFAAQKLYGLSFTRRMDLPLYHPDVEIYEVKNADGSPLALFIIDFYARNGKRGGAWMNEYVPQSGLLGQLPVVGNHLNIPRPAAGEACLLNYDDVVTMFHEFGHALHGMLSQVRYPIFAGTNVPRDFVEYPSQINEMWMLWPEVLENYARHYQTGAAMPKELLQKLQAGRQFNQGFATTEYLAAATLDFRWHQLNSKQIPTDALAFEAKVLQEAGLDFAPVPPRYRSTYFSHSFGGGYAAGYYAYLWSEKLDADTEQWFIENGGLTRKNGDLFRRHLLSRGGSADAMQLYQQFRGRNAQIGPLLERRGLAQAASAKAGQ